MGSTASNLFSRAWRKFFLNPAGYGRPAAKEVFDREYASGAWAHFYAEPELARQETVVNAVMAQFSAPTILDLGCGSGRLAQLFQAHPFRRYVGIDLSAEGLRMARALNLQRCEFIEGNFETWRTTEKFDAVLFSECLGYADDPGKVAASFVPALADGGVVVVSHFRSGHWPALWRRVEKTLAPFEGKTVTNRLGQIWDVKLLRPRK